MRRILPLLVVFGCGEHNGGTAVGNPGKLAMSVEGLPDGTTLEQGTFDVAALELVGDRRRVSIVKFDEPFDLVEPAEVAFPGGDWNMAVVLPRGDQPLQLQGRNPDGSLFEVALPVEPMIFEGDLSIDGDPVVIQLAVVTGTRGDDASGEPPEPSGLDNENERVLGSFGVGQSLAVDGTGLANQGQVFTAQDQATRGGCNTAPITLSALWRR